jgi:uncharacterized protein YkwD
MHSAYRRDPPESFSAGRELPARHDSGVRSLVVTVVLIGIFALAFELATRESAVPRDPCGPTRLAPAETGVEAAGTATLCLINRERARAGLGAFVPNARLTQAAVAHSRDMVGRRFFEHDSPDGVTPQDRIRSSGYGGGGRSAGENIAWGAGADATPAAIVNLWMHSPGHRADILRPAFREIGIGIELGVPVDSPSKGATYTTDFGGVTDPGLPTG